MSFSFVAHSLRSSSWFGVPLARPIISIYPSVPPLESIDLLAIVVSGPIHNSHVPLQCAHQRGAGDV